LTEPKEKRPYTISVIPGDGIGPEVTDEALRVLEAVSGATGVTFQTKSYPFGGDHFLATGDIFPAEAFREVSQTDAVLLGAIGDPRVERGLLERGIVGKLRWDLDLYVNLRPIKLYAEHLCPVKGKGPDDVDMLVVRENTEDVYTGPGGFLKKGTPDEVAVQEMMFTRKGVERIVRYAFEAARKREGREGRRRLTLVDKANAVSAFDLWRRTFEEVGREYPDVEGDTAYVDAACMWMVKNPEWFDTVVTSNMFGDIVTDLGAMIQGGMGLGGSGNIHPGKVSMFEPIHGSAPRHAGQNKANPLAAIMAVQLMLDFLGETRSAQALEEAVARLLRDRVIPSVAADGTITTREIGDLVVQEVSAELSAGAAGA
jgi:3-isopropylmalate dehydrogenase